MVSNPKQIQIYSKFSAVMINLVIAVMNTEVEKVVHPVNLVDRK